VISSLLHHPYGVVHAQSIALLGLALASLREVLLIVSFSLVHSMIQMIRTSTLMLKLAAEIATTNKRRRAATFIPNSGSKNDSGVFHSFCASNYSERELPHAGRILSCNRPWHESDLVRPTGVPAVVARTLSGRRRKKAVLAMMGREEAERW
jgi:hypothetical protein